MIFFETSKNKIFFLSFLVVISTIFVALVWLKFAPDKQGLKIKAVALISDEVKTQVNDNLQNMQDSFALGTEQIKDLQGEFIQEQKQKALLEVTKKYLAEKQATSTQEKNN